LIEQLARDTANISRGERRPLVMRKSRSWFMRQKDDIKEKQQDLVRVKAEKQIKQ